MKILIAGIYRWPIYAPAFSTALVNLGVEVEQFQFESFLKGSGQAARISLGIDPGIIRLNWKLRETIRQLHPDVCLVWNGLAVWPSTIRFISQHCWVTSYTNDDPFGPRGQARFWRFFRKSIPFYHSHHVFRDLNVPEYKSLGAKRVGILRAYYVPWFHYPEIDRDCQTPNSVSFIGHGEPRRVDVLARLVESGIQVDVYGDEKKWGGLKNLGRGVRFHSGFVFPERYRKVISSSAISLGFLAHENRDDYTRRYFEIPACQGFLLGEDTELAKQLFVEDEEAAFFSSTDELIQKCKFFLSQSHLRDKITINGYRRCLDSGYDVVSRANTWLDEIIAFMRDGRP